MLVNTCMKKYEELNKDEYMSDEAIHCLWTSCKSVGKKNASIANVSMLT